MVIDFFLSYNNGEEILFLKNPPSAIEVNYSSNDTEMLILNLGKIINLNEKGLQSITFSSFFEKDEYNKIYKIVEWKDSGNPIRLIIGDFLNMAAAISNFNWKKNSANGSFLNFNITLKEFLFIYKAEVALTEKGDILLFEDELVREDPRVKPSVYEVKAGESLWSIARDIYHDSEKWMALAKINNVKPPYTIHPAQKLRIV